MNKHSFKLFICELASLLVALPVSAIDEVTDTKQSEVEVTLGEMLTVTVTKDKVSDSGDIPATGDIFLKDYTQLHIQTNNPEGFSATMTTKTTDTALKNLSNTNITIPTLANNVTSEASFPVGNWGFSLNGSNATTAVYHPLIAFGSANPSVIARSDTMSDTLVDLYFGTKGNASTAAGTYTNAVIISVTAPPESNNPPIEPIEPVNPPSEDPTPPSAPSRNIAYTTPEDSESEPSSSYEKPQGVSEDTTKEIINKSNLSMSLATGFTTTAVSGIIIFILAKRKDDEDEDGEEDKK